MTTTPRGVALLVRTASAFAVVATLTGSLVVSCSGDPLPSTGGGSAAPASASMGRWTPATQDTCTKEFHDTYFVVGPDGKKYPTWHPPEATDPDTNRLCSFGHEHGLDPRDSAQWSELQAHFAFDANRNGLVDNDELAVSGIPFGLVAEQLVNSTTPRLEDHTAYKILFNDDVARVLRSAGQGFDLRCNLFAAYNQPTSTEDAFASNMFSVTYAVDCSNGTSAALYPVRVIVSVMALYRTPRSFTLDATGAQQDVDTPPVPPSSPDGGDELGRRIPARTPVFDGVFVAANQTSNFDVLFERWDTKLRVRRANNDEVATLVPAFRVRNPARYFDNGIARSIDLCYFGLDAGGTLVTDPAVSPTIVRQVRPNCSIAPNGTSTPVANRIGYDDPRSPFNACRRDAFFGSDVVRNPGGPTTWYTDAFGGSASTVVFANSIRQLIRQGDTLAVELGEAAASQQPCGATTVHAPN